MKKFMRKILGGLFVLVLSACGPQIPIMELNRTEYNSITGWQEDDLSQALTAYEKSCGYFMKRAAALDYGYGPWETATGTWRDICEKMAQLDEAEKLNPRQFFETHFTPYHIDQEGGSDGLFTGYFVPLLKGSRICKGEYTVPLYARPTGLPSGSALYSRAKIVSGALGKKAKPIVCVNDAVDAFFMEIQGSGIVELPDGKRIELGYAGQNGHQYIPIGRVMKEREMLEEDNVSMKSIKAWLRSNPNQAQAVMNENPSYVFFRELKDGIVGAQGVNLTPERSLAVDKRYFPLGLPIFLASNLPEDAPHEEAGKDFVRLMIAQDTGGAIKGPRRGDVFFGAGERAAALAGYMKEEGKSWALIPNRIALEMGEEVVWQGR